jgi:hypothetical protein
MHLLLAGFHDETQGVGQSSTLDVGPHLRVVVRCQLGSCLPAASLPSSPLPLCFLLRSLLTFWTLGSALLLLQQQRRRHLPRQAAGQRAPQGTPQLQRPWKEPCQPSHRSWRQLLMLQPSLAAGRSFWSPEVLACSLLRQALWALCWHCLARQRM